MLQVRYHQNFQGKETLLIAGAPKDLDRLRSVFIKWDGEELDLIRHLKAQGELYLFSVKHFHIRRDRIKRACVWSSNIGTWFISASYKETIVDILSGLQKTDHPGFQYLDYAGPGNIRLLMSRDEPPLSADGKIIERVVLSREGISFTAESVTVLRHDVKTFERANSVPCLSISEHKDGRVGVSMGGNYEARPNAIQDQLEDTSFAWHALNLDRIRKRFIVDLGDQRKSNLIPLPEKNDLGITDSVP